MPQPDPQPDAGRERPIRVLLAVRHRLVCDALEALMGDDPTIEVVGTAGDGHDAVGQAATLRPDVAVVEVRLRGLDGPDVARRLAAGPDGPPVVAIADSRDDPLAGETLRAGAVCCVAKSAAFAELAAAIRRAAGPPDPAGPEPRSSAFAALSKREREVMTLLANGCTIKAAAAAMGVGPKTAETHRRNLQVKLGVDSIAGLTKYAIRHGLTDA